MIRKICVITGSRAEYGLLRWVMQGIKDDSALELQIIATGMHLSPTFGNTYQEIEGHGFEINRKVQTLTGSDTPVGIASSMSRGLIGVAGALEELKPDLVVVLGDRFEIFSAVAAALVAQTPVAHIHGGELTEGSFDDALRHSITKMAHLHFVAANEYRNRVIQLGESPDRVHNVGGLGVDSVNNIELETRKNIEKDLKIRLREKNLLVTFHPVTLEADYGIEHLTRLLSALDSFPEIGLIFTMPNADPGGDIMRTMIQEYVRERENATAFVSLGSEWYLSLMAIVDGVVGNSSSGLLEAPTMRVGTLNIGDRQRGRIQATSVISCEPIIKEIQIALDKLLSDNFRHLARFAESPFGAGGAAKAIVEILKRIEWKDVMQKRFHDCLDQN